MTNNNEITSLAFTAGKLLPEILDSYSNMGRYGRKITRTEQKMAINLAMIESEYRKDVTLAQIEAQKQIEVEKIKYNFLLERERLRAGKE